MVFVAILIPTFRRPEMLSRCLASIAEQDLMSSDGYHISVVVGDNNPDAAASAQILNMQEEFPCDLISVQVPEPGLCHNRNALFAKAVELGADYIALIDDDEWASADWLSSLIEGMVQTNADIMIGPVHTEFHPDTPEWFKNSGIGQTNIATTPSRQVASAQNSQPATQF